MPNPCWLTATPVLAKKGVQNKRQVFPKKETISNKISLNACAYLAAVYYF
jgi:hypothetical protein